MNKFKIVATTGIGITGGLVGLGQTASADIINLSGTYKGSTINASVVSDNAENSTFINNVVTENSNISGSYIAENKKTSTSETSNDTAEEIVQSIISSIDVSEALSNSQTDTMVAGIIANSNNALNINDLSQEDLQDLISNYNKTKSINNTADILATFNQQDLIAGLTLTSNLSGSKYLFGLIQQLNQSEYFEPENYTVALDEAEGLVGIDFLKNAVAFTDPALELIDLNNVDATASDNNIKNSESLVKQYASLGTLAAKVDLLASNAKTIDPQSTEVDSIFNGISSILHDMLDTIGSGLGDALAAGLNAIPSDKLADLLPTILNALNLIGIPIPPELSGLLGLAGDIIAPIIKPILAALLPSIVDALMIPVKALVDQALNSIKDLADNISDHLDSIMASITVAINDVFNWLVDNLPDFIEWASGWIEYFVSEISNIIHALLPIIIDWINNIQNQPAVVTPTNPADSASGSESISNSNTDSTSSSTSNSISSGSQNNSSSRSTQKPVKPGKPAQVVPVAKNAVDTSTKNKASGVAAQLPKTGEVENQALAGIAFMLATVAFGYLRRKDLI